MNSRNPLRGERGAVIIPAFNEAAVIERLVGLLSPAAIAGELEVIVVCNGCTDGTEVVARGVPGIRVIELDQGSKPAALNAGDAAAFSWPRLYLDADVEISLSHVFAVLDCVASEKILAASPKAVYDPRGATWVVRSYYRARERLSLHDGALWQAGAYAVSRAGHDRIGRFPAITGDDFFVDCQFDDSEKAVLTTALAMRRTPRTARNLLAIMRRHRRGNAEVLGDTAIARKGHVRDTGSQTAVAVLATIRGPQTAIDAFVYVTLSVLSRLARRQPGRWERDDSSRLRS